MATANRRPVLDFLCRIFGVEEDARWKTDVYCYLGHRHHDTPVCVNPKKEAAGYVSGPDDVDGYA